MPAVHKYMHLGMVTPEKPSALLALIVDGIVHNNGY